MDENGINSLITDYQQTLTAENAAQLAWEDAKAALEFEKLRVVQDAANSLVIDAKNVGDRDRQAALVIGMSQSVAFLEEYEREARIKYESTAVFRKCFEINFSMQKALLYAQAGNVQRVVEFRA